MLDRVVVAAGEGDTLIRGHLRRTDVASGRKGALLYKWWNRTCIGADQSDDLTIPRHVYRMERIITCSTNRTRRAWWRLYQLGVGSPAIMRMDGNLGSHPQSVCFRDLLPDWLDCRTAHQHVSRICVHYDWGALRGARRDITTRFLTRSRAYPSMSVLIHPWKEAE